MMKATVQQAVQVPVVQTKIGKLLGRNWALFFLVAMVVIFAFTGPGFFEIVNFQNIIHLADFDIIPENFVLNHFDISKAVISEEDSGLVSILIEIGGGR